MLLHCSKRLIHPENKIDTSRSSPLTSSTPVAASSLEVLSTSTSLQESSSPIPWFNQVVFSVAFAPLFLPPTTGRPLRLSLPSRQLNSGCSLVLLKLLLRLSFMSLSQPPVGEPTVSADACFLPVERTLTFPIFVSSLGKLSANFLISRSFLSLNRLY